MMAQSEEHCSAPEGRRCPLHGKRKELWLVAAAMLAVLAVALMVTRDLPQPRMYETRYEFRVRNYLKNVEAPERVMASLALRDSYWLRGYVDSLPVPEGLTRRVQYDPTEKITFLVRGMDSATVADYAAGLYGLACDTVTRYGDEMCARMAEVLRCQIDQLPPPTTDSLQLLQKELYACLATLETDNEGGVKYVYLLNGAELPQAQRTPSRGWIVLLSTLAALLFGVAVCLLKDLSWMSKDKRTKNEDC